MTDTKRTTDSPGQDPNLPLDGKTRTWLNEMLPHLDRLPKPSTGSAPQNTPNVLHLQNLSRSPQIALAGPAPPADVDPLTAAVKARDAYKVQQYVTLLIISGYHLGGPDSNGDIPLILAAESNDFIITTMVMGPNPNPTNSAGETPLIIASQLGNAQTVAFLLKKKANITFKDNAQQTAVDYALQNQQADPSNKDHAQIVTLLQDAQKKRNKRPKP
jgi:ankyrin repeat protein